MKSIDTTTYYNFIPLKAGKQYYFFLSLMIGISLYIFYPYIFPSDFRLLVDNYDGAKNYYSMISYIFDGQYHDMLQFNGMNYPYGERIYYTDNVPILSLLFKYIQQFVSIESPSFYLRVFHILIAISFPLTFVFLFKILRSFDINRIFSGWAAICISFLSPQIIQLNSNINLGITLFTIIPIYFAIRIFNAINNGLSVKKLLVLLFVFMYIVSFVHLYYLVINGVFLGLFFLFWGLKHIRDIEILKRISISVIVSIILPLVSVLLTIYLTDPFLGMRKSAMGYNYNEWKFDFFSPIVSMPGRTLLPFKIPNLIVPNGSYSFIGYFSILVILAVVFIYTQKSIHYLKRKTDGNHSLIGILLLSALACYFITLGPVYHSSMFQKDFINIFNIFLYIGLLTDKIEHFRFLFRFWWPVHWILLIVVVFTVDRAVIKKKIIKTQLLRFSLLFFLIVLLTLDGISLPYMLTHEKKHNFLSSQVLSEQVPAVVQKEIDKGNYQAFLPLPFFNIGSENYNYSIDGEGLWNKKTFQFQIASKLPMVATLLSRTAEYQAINLFNFVLSGKPSPSLLQKLNKKDILVIYHDKFVQDTHTYNDKLRDSLIVKQKDMPELYHMQLLLDVDGIKYYRWPYSEFAAM